jgi:hypothetical protein
MAKCAIDGCEEQGTWQSKLCAGCRAYIGRVEQQTLGWRIKRLEVITKWGARLGRAISAKSNVVSIRRKRRNG